MYQHCFILGLYFLLIAIFYLLLIMKWSRLKKSVNRFFAIILGILLIKFNQLSSYVRSIVIVTSKWLCYCVWRDSFITLGIFKNLLLLMFIHSYQPKYTQLMERTLALNKMSYRLQTILLLFEYNLLQLFFLQLLSLACKSQWFNYVRRSFVEDYN